MVMVYHLCNWRSNLVDVMGSAMAPGKLLKCLVRGPTVPKPLEE